MSYFLNTVAGESVKNPDETEIRDVLAGLQNADEEHSDVSLVHQSGWSLSIFPDRKLLWENIEDSRPSKEMELDSWDAVIDVLMKLAQGNIAAVKNLGLEHLKEDSLHASRPVARG